MSKSTISTFELFQMFPDQGSARLYLESRLWPDDTAVRAVKLGIAEEIENHSYLAGTHEMCVWIDGLTNRLREGGK